MPEDAMPADYNLDYSSDESDCEDMVGEGYIPPDPMEPETVPWDITISDADFKRLQVGFRPKSQDDKWLFMTTGPDEAGVTSVHIVRYFSHIVFYTLHVKPGDDDNGGRLKVHSFTWEKNVCVPKTEEEAKEHAVLLCRGHLDCDFEELPWYDFFEEYLVRVTDLSRGDFPERETQGAARL